jgi:hypothetical protein
MITFGISVRIHELNTGVLQPRGVTKKVTHTSLRREKLWILGTEEFLGLPCSLLLEMMALLNLVESDHPSPHDSVLPTQKLHQVLRIRQVSIKRHDIINDDVSGWLQTFL